MFETDASDTILQAVVHGNALHNAIVETLEGFPQPPGHRSRVAFQLCALSLSHGTGVRNLLAMQEIAPAFALLRPQLETLVRMDWLRCVAGEGWVEAYVKGAVPGFEERAEFKDIEALITQLQVSPSCLHAGAYAKFQREALLTFHGLTHGGVESVNLTLGVPEQSALEYLRVSNYMTIVAGEVLAFLIGTEASHRVKSVSTRFDPYLRDTRQAPLAV